MKVLQYQVFSSATMEASKTSSVIDISGCYGYFLQWQYSGSPTGSIVCQGSVDGVTYYDISTDSLSGGKGFKNQDAAYWQYLKITFTRTGGLVSELLNAQIFLKGI